MTRPQTLLAAAVLCCSLVPRTGRAQPEPFDASIPDASVDQGGADLNSQENQDSTGATQTTCRSSGDCDKGFQCQGTRCVYVGYKRAQSGCFMGTEATVVAVGFGLALKRRRRRRR